MVKILIVDDDQQASALVAKALNARGYRTRVEANGAAALLAAHDDLPDLIVMDLNMPILAGKETLRALRHDAETAHIPVIALSAVDDKPTLAGAVVAGANVYVPKPYEMGTLLAAVERLVAVQSRNVPCDD